MNNKITINGLMDGISSVEKDNVENKPCIQSDILYNDQEPIDFKLDVTLQDEDCEFTKI